MNATEVYSLLLAGKKLAMAFDERKAAETFRVRLHAIKQAQEKHLIGLGMMEEEDVPTFSFKQVTERQWELQFIKQKPRKDYNVVILDDGT